MVAFGIVTDVIAASFQEWFAEVDLLQGANAFFKVQLGWKAMGFIWLLLSNVTGALLFIEGGFFGENSCYTQGWNGV
jgi:hypothetical protein